MTIGVVKSTHRHVTRAAILDLLGRSDGDYSNGRCSVRHLTALIRAAGFGVRTEGVLDHLNQLVDGGHVERSRLGNVTLYRAVRS